MNTETRASWIFGSLFVLFILGVFLLGPDALPTYKQQILAYVCSLLAGCFGVFLTGTLLVHAELPLPGKWTIRGGAGFALFLVILFWWNSSYSPIQSKPTKVADVSKSSTEMPVSSPTNQAAAAPDAQAHAKQPVTEPVLERIGFAVISDPSSDETPPSAAFIVRRYGQNLTGQNMTGKVGSDPFRRSGPFYGKVGAEDPPLTKERTKELEVVIIGRNNDPWSGLLKVHLVFTDGTFRDKSFNFSILKDKPQEIFYWEPEIKK